MSHDAVAVTGSEAQSMETPQCPKRDTALAGRLGKLKQFADSANWDDVCEWAETNLPEVHSHLQTWGAHCGAPISVYRGHLVRILVDIIGKEQAHKEFHIEYTAS